MLLDNVPLANPDFSRPANDLRSGIAAELALFLQPKVFFAAVALVLVPALCIWIYLGSVWNPDENLARLPVAIVNQDVPVVQAGREINLGGQIVATLEKERPFAFVRYDKPETARAAVQTGKVFFALLVPADFSRRSLAPGQPAQLALYVSEGGNYTASLLAKRFGADLAHSLNEKLNRERWGTWMGATGTEATPTLGSGLVALQAGGKRLVEDTRKIRDGSARLRDGFARVALGAGSMAESSSQLADVTTRLTGVVKQVDASVASLLSTLPDDHKLDELAQGSLALARSAGDLKQALGQLQPGVVQLDNGTGKLQAGAARVLFVGGKLSAGAAQVRSDVSILGEAIGRAAGQAAQLNDGIGQFTSVVQPLSSGFITVNGGLRSISEKLPPVEQLDLFDRSMGKLRDGGRSLVADSAGLNKGAVQLEEDSGNLEKGAVELAAGLNEAVSRFDAGFSGSRARLAAPVETVVEVVAPVLHNGPAFAPWFAALSLWVGAVIMSFVFHVRRLPGSMRRASRPVRWMVKAAPLFALGVLQATAVVAAFRWMGITMANPSLVWLVAVIGSVTFVSVVILLITVLGDIGRLLAVVLLIFQLAASGGIYPIELSSAFYQKAHDYLPFTYLVQAFRATLFAALDGQWTPLAGMLGIFAAAAMLLGMALARWKYVAKETYGAAVDF